MSIHMLVIITSKLFESQLLWLREKTIQGKIIGRKVGEMSIITNVDVNFLFIFFQRLGVSH